MIKIRLKCWRRSLFRAGAARVAAGAIAKKVLKELGVEITAYTLSIGDIEIDRNKFDRDEIYRNFLAMPDKEAAGKAEALLYKRKEEDDSAGGVIECIVEGLPSGVGEPVFEKLDAALAKAVFSIGAVKDLKLEADLKQLKCLVSSNDEYQYDENGKLKKLTNRVE